METEWAYLLEGQNVQETYCQLHETTAVKLAHEAFLETVAYQ